MSSVLNAIPSVVNPVAGSDRTMRIVMTVTGGTASMRVEDRAGHEIAWANPDATAACRLKAEIAALDAAGVRNGFKAISIWLWSNWRGELLDRWGPHSNVHVIRYWRSVHRRRRSSA